MKKRLVLAVGLGAAALLALAPPPTNPWQNWNLTVQPEEHRAFPLPNHGTDEVSGTFDSILVGDLTGNGDADSVLLAGGETHVQFAVGVHTTSSYFASGVDSMTLQGGVAPYGRDVVLVSTSAGIDEYRWDETAQDLGSPTNVLSIADSKNAPILVSGNLDSQPGDDIVFVSANDDEYIYGYRNVSGTLTSFFDYAIEEPAEDITLMDWSGNGVDDMVIASVGGVRIYNRAGTKLEEWIGPTSGGNVICSLESNTTPTTDTLLWARRNSTDTYHELMVLPAGTSTLPSGIPLTPQLGTGPYPSINLDVHTLSTGDCDGDGDQDLLVGHTSNMTVALYGNRGTASLASFGSGNNDYRLIALGEDPTLSGSGLTAEPTLRDVDGDGRADNVIPVESRHAIVLHGHLPEFASGGSVIQPVVTGPFSAGGYEIDYDDVADEFNDLEHEYRMELSVPGSWVAPGSLFDHVQVQVFNEAPDTNGDPSEVLQPDGMVNDFFEIVTGQDTDIHVVVDLSDLDGTNPDTDIASPWNDGQNLWIGMRFVDVLDPDPVTSDDWDTGDSTAWWVVALTLDPDENYDGLPTSASWVDYLENHTYSANDTYEIEAFGSPTPPRTILGLKARMGRFPTIAGNGTVSLADPELGGTTVSTL